MATSLPNANISESEDNIPKWILARKGLQLLINNKEQEAVKLFEKYPDSIHMYAGHATTLFIDALMSFEEDKLNQALCYLKEAEKKCSVDSGWLNSLRAKVIGSDLPNLGQQLESQIILADSYVLIAILTFLQQDLSGYFRGGWILRKSWKLYHEIYNEISKLYKDIVGDTNSDSETSNLSNVPEDEVRAQINGYINNSTYAEHALEATFLPKQSISCHEELSEANHSNSHIIPSLKKSTSVNSALSKHQNRSKRLSARFSSFTLSYFTSTFNIFTSDSLKANIDKETICRLMGAVSFGYGLLQLGISLLPPTLLRITNILGFQGNRQLGIANLMFARMGSDMRAPLATLALLWYHTIVRPFYALDGSNVQAGVEAASQLIEETKEEYSDSAMFLFFKGRVLRLNSDISQALIAFEASVNNSKQREIQILSMHEIGWCHLIQLNFKLAENTFFIMKTNSRWSRSFYAYMSTVCAGALGEDITTQINELKKLMTQIPKGTQLDAFLVRRYDICIRNAADSKKTFFWKMLVYEMLYLWNTMPSCSSESITVILNDCSTILEETIDEPMVGVSKLIEGCCFCVRNEFTKGIASFRKCLESRTGMSYNAPDAHISAFACYEVGMHLVKNPETKTEGKFLLQQTNLYKDYDFEQRLSVRVNMLTKRYA